MIKQVCIGSLLLYLLTYYQSTTMNVCSFTYLYYSSMTAIKSISPIMNEQLLKKWLILSSLMIGEQLLNVFVDSGLLTITLNTIKLICLILMIQNQTDYIDPFYNMMVKLFKQYEFTFTNIFINIQNTIKSFNLSSNGNNSIYYQAIDMFNNSVDNIRYYFTKSN